MYESTNIVSKYKIGQRAINTADQNIVRNNYP